MAHETESVSSDGLRHLATLNRRVFDRREMSSVARFLFGIWVVALIGAAVLLLPVSSDSRRWVWEIGAFGRIAWAWWALHVLSVYLIGLFGFAMARGIGPKRDSLFQNLAALAILMLVAAPLPWPYGYFQLLRLVVTAAAIVGAWLAYQGGETGWAVGLGVIALLFNPVAPVAFERIQWAVVDLVVAGCFYAALVQPGFGGPAHPQKKSLPSDLP